MRFIFIVFLFAGVFANAEAQEVTIELSYKYDKSTPYFSRDSFYFQLNKTLYPSYSGEVIKHKLKKMQFSKSGDLLKTTVTYELQDTSLAIVADLYGHELTLLPNDTIKIYSRPEIKTDKQLPWQRNFTYSGPNRYIHAIFDSLAYLSGDVKMDIIKVNGKSISQCLAYADGRFEQRSAYLKGYCERYNISKAIQELIAAEIYSAYVRDLVFIQSAQLMSKQAQDLVQMISAKTDFNKLKTSEFQKTVVASPTAYEFLLYLKLPFDTANFYSKDRFLRVYALIKQNYNGAMRDDMLSWHMGRFIRSGFNTFLESGMIRYKADCKDRRSVAYIDSLYRQKKKALAFTYKEVLNSRVADPEGKMQTINDLIKGKPTLIDCWASWCKPCIGEFPASGKLKEMYKGRVNFLYLSFDKDVASWTAKVDELGLTNTYRVADSFDSAFAAYFKLTAIPRYILIDARGNLINKDAPRPGDLRLKGVLDQLLGNSGGK